MTTSRSYGAKNIVGDSQLYKHVAPNGAKTLKRFWKEVGGFAWSDKKANGRDKRGSASRLSIFVVTVLTPATTETEDSPTASSCPTIYIATRVPGNAHVVDFIEGYDLLRL